MKKTTKNSQLNTGEIFADLALCNYLYFFFFFVVVVVVVVAFMLLFVVIVVVH